MSNEVVPFSLKDAPSLIEKLFPVQKLSIESYKEQMAGGGKTLTGLGNYWKGRKPLILNKACVLGSLLPSTGDATRDLEVFEMLMGFDQESFVARSKRTPKPKEILGKLAINCIEDYFNVDQKASCRNHHRLIGPTNRMKMSALHGTTTLRTKSVLDLK